MLNCMVEWFIKIITDVTGGAAKRMCLEKKGDFLDSSSNCKVVSFTDTSVTEQLSHASSAKV